MRQYLSQLEKIRDDQRERLGELSDYSKIWLKPILKRTDRIYYGACEFGGTKIRYIGDASKPEVCMIREERYLSKSLAAIEHDILLIEAFLEGYQSISFSDINSRLPKTYRADIYRADVRNMAARKWKKQAEELKASFGVFRPEELIHSTIDGTLVRSKSEALIYNTLVEGGYTFAYELPLRGQNRLFYPDFTVLSEIDYKTEVRIEHQGMFGKSDYRDRSVSREYDYWNSGFLPARDVFFTFDDNKGGFDIGPVLDILKSHVRP
jgi:hypothetical protein